MPSTAFGPGMDLSALPGYRWAVQGQYGERFRRERPEDVARAQQVNGAYAARVLAALELLDEGRFLDVGCGAGWFTLLVAGARPSVEAVGIDGAPEALALAREAAVASGAENARFVEASAEAPPGGPFERGCAMSLFNLLPEKRAGLRAWRRVMPRGARFVLTDAFVSSGPGSSGSGAMSWASFVALARECGWRVARREDLTPLVRKLNEEQAWLWPEYMRPGFRYLLVALESV